MNDIMRNDFEVLAMTNGFESHHLRLREGGDYADYDLRRLFLPWKASREYLLIELRPPHNDYSYDDSEVNGACKYYEQAKKAIESAGIKTK